MIFITLYASQGRGQALTVEYDNPKYVNPKRHKHTRWETVFSCSPHNFEIRNECDQLSAPLKKSLQRQDVHAASNCGCGLSIETVQGIPQPLPFCKKIHLHKSQLVLNIMQPLLQGLPTGYFGLNKQSETHDSHVLVSARLQLNLKLLEKVQQVMEILQIWLILEDLV